MSQEVQSKKKIMILPGNGFFNINQIWYPSVHKRFQEMGLESHLQTFPDPLKARKHIWIPFVSETLNLERDSQDVILIGHSSGSCCAMRIAEKHQLFGLVLVSAYDNSLGDNLEQQSGYFDDEWDWQAIRKNVKWIIQFHSEDDPLVPFEEGKKVAHALALDESCFAVDQDQGHYNMSDEFPKLIQSIEKHLSK